MTTISMFVNAYIAGRDITKEYACNLRKRGNKLAAFVGSRKVAELFTEFSVNKFLATLDGLAPRTVRSYRSDLLALWNAAADFDLVGYPTMRRIRRPKCPKLRIECFSHAEVQAIVAQAEKCFPYTMGSGITRDVYWPAMIRLAWDTGLRRGDCSEFRQSWIRADGTASVIQGKTQQTVVVRLHPSTVAALARIPHDKATHWPGALKNSSRFGRQFKDIVTRAGVPRGTFKWLRRSSGSYVEMALPGSGGKHLGHSSPEVFAAHYDAKLGGHTAPMPPDLGGDAPEAASIAFDEFAFM